MSRWSKSEQPIRAAFWLNSLSTLFVGLISYGIGQSHTAIAQWRLLYLILGGFTMAWAILVLIFLPDSPTNCWYMSEREKFIALQRVKDNNTGMEDKTLKPYQIKECILDPRTWLIVLFGAAQNVTNGKSIHVTRKAV